MFPSQIDKTRAPVLNSVIFPPNEDISEKKLMIVFETNPEEIMSAEKQNLKPGIKYDISRVSTKNARKNELGPYKTSFLRQIISSHRMGKTNGTKNELVATILDFYEKNTK